MSLSPPFHQSSGSYIGHERNGVRSVDAFRGTAIQASSSHRLSPPDSMSIRVNPASAMGRDTVGAPPFGHSLPLLHGVPPTLGSEYGGSRAGASRPRGGEGRVTQSVSSRTTVHAGGAAPEGTARGEPEPSPSPEEADDPALLLHAALMRGGRAACSLLSLISISAARVGPPPFPALAGGDALQQSRASMPSSSSFAALGASSSGDPESNRTIIRTLAPSIIASHFDRHCSHFLKQSSFLPRPSCHG